METKEKTIITVETTVNAPVDQVWKLWTLPEHITQWNNASDDWHTPHAENDMQIGGGFLCRMEAKDGSFGFDFSGKYLEIKENELIVYVIDDGRKVHISFEAAGNATSIIESFEAEGVNSLELQKSGWQSILDNFKKYAESKNLEV